MSENLNDGLVEPPTPRQGRRTVLGYTGLVVLAFLVGAPAAYMIRANQQVSYTAEGNLWIEVASQGSNDVTSVPPHVSNAWIELLRSYRVLDAVVVDQGLYVRSPAEHAQVFSTFSVAEKFAPGAYELRVGATGDDFVLATAAGALVQQARFGTPVGEVVGFAWTPALRSFESGITVEFSVVSGRDAARDLSERLVTVMDREGHFLRLQLEGSDRQKVTDVVNALMEHYVQVAAELKISKLRETVVVLEEQLLEMELELQQTERNLEELRVGAVGASSDGSPEIDEGRLRRRIETTAMLYDEIRARVVTARLAMANSQPDVRILDRASILH